MTKKHVGTAVAAVAAIALSTAAFAGTAVAAPADALPPPPVGAAQQPQLPVGAVSGVLPVGK